jgi:multiple sugar transport system substrate-binding protein
MKALVRLLVLCLLSSLVLAACGDSTATPVPATTVAATTAAAPTTAPTTAAAATTAAATTAAATTAAPTAAPTKAPTTAAAANGPVVTLRYASWADGAGAKDEQAAIDTFNKAHPNIQVQYEAWGGAYDDKLSASIAAGDAPDVLAVWNFPKYAAGLMPLDDLLAKTPELSNDYNSQILNFAKFNNHVFGVPNGWTGRVVYYNKKLFDDAKLPYPTDDWTWDQMKDIAAKLTDKSKGQYGYGADTDLYVMQSYFWNNGGDILSPDGKTTNGYLNSAAAKDTIKKLYEMYKQGSMLLNIAGDSGTTQTAVNQTELFQSGKLAMMDNGVWQVQDWKKAGVDVGSVLLPKMSGDRVGLLHASFWAISKTTKNVDATWEVIKYMQSIDWAKNSKDFNARKSIVNTFSNDPAKSLVTPKDPLNVPQFETLTLATKQPWFLRNGNWAEAQRTIQNGIQSILLKGADIDKTMDSLVNQADSYLK